MSCHDVQLNLSLYLYGELEFAEEEQLEQHLDSCAACQLAFAREKEWHTAAAAEHRDVPLDILSDCRLNLRQALEAEHHAVAPPAARRWNFSWTWPEAWRITPHRWSYQTAAASFLIFLGYAGGHIYDRLHSTDNSGSRLVASSLFGNRVSNIERSGPNQVRISVQQTKQQEVVGNPHDENIQHYLIISSKDPNDPGIRVVSVEMLSGQTSYPVRDALLDRAQHDANAAVRLKAVQSLNSFVDDPITRNALRAILEHDPDPAVRSQVIDLLVPASTRPQLTPDVAATLRMHILSEQDDFVRAHCLDLLRAAAAPDGPVY